MKLMLKSGLLAAMMIALVGASAAQAGVFSGNLPLNACQSGKAKCVIKMKSCMLGCWNKVIGKGGSIDNACLDKCRNGFFGDPAAGKGCIEKLEGKNGVACNPGLGEGPVLRSKVQAHVLDLVSQLAPALPPAGNKCAAGKTKCVIKYNACVLGLAGKALKAGGPIGDLSKCNALLTGAGSCVGKLEAKYGQAGCLTTDDQPLLKAADDAFVNDVLYGWLGATDMNTQRCNGDTSVTCTSAPGGVAGCGGPLGTCEFFFGAPLPLAAGGIASCVTSQWNGAITGTFEQENGKSGGSAKVLSRVYTGGNTITNPCPVCSDPIPNDGIAGGTCSTGARAGLGCDSNGESPIPSFGKTSLDCPPSGGTLVATLPIDLSNTNTGTVTKALSAGSPNCNAAGYAGLKCMCGACSLNSSVPCFTDTDCSLVGAGTCTSAAGQPRAPSACLDNTDTVGLDCAATTGGNGECIEGPVDSVCQAEPFRACSNPATDCANPADICIVKNRSCYPGYNGVVGDTISATGSVTAPHNHTGTSNFASVFCVAPTGSSAVNAAAGLPGPGRLALGGVSSEDGTDSLCPTQATFLPTAKSGVLDTGWTGLAHNATVVGQGKVTVSVTGCTGSAGSCHCTYTGPVAN